MANDRRVAADRVTAIVLRLPPRVYVMQGKFCQARVLCESSLAVVAVFAAGRFIHRVLRRAMPREALGAMPKIGAE